MLNVFFLSYAESGHTNQVWSSLVGRNLPIRTIDSAFQLPSLLPILQIMFSSSIRSLHRPIYWSACLVTYILVTITPPAALVVRPMNLVQTDLRVPNINFSADPRLYAVMNETWGFVRPTNHLRRFMRNRITANDILDWPATRQCRYGCEYNTTYFAPGLKCVDYTPDPSAPELGRNRTYRGSFNITENYLSLNVTVWPLTNGVHRVGAYNTTPIGTRCTFHNTSYTAAVEYGMNRQYSRILNRTVLSDQTFVGLPLGFVNSYSCPRSVSWSISRLEDVPGCAKAQMNSWAFIDAFSQTISGTIVIHPLSIGPISQYPNNALMPNLDRLFNVDEDSKSFNLAPWAQDLGLGNALEALFSNATLSLTRDAYNQNWTTVTREARAVPFANQYVYAPHQLWIAYGSALGVTFIAGLFAYLSCEDDSVPSDESNLSRILTATRDRSFNRIDGLSQREVDDVVIKYGEAKHGGMVFTVVSERRVHASESTIGSEDTGLLRKWSLRSV
ncbi:hypothetical protein RHS04_06289 [Rhizoctonia solani]|uniref:Uncharacterized protein n=1 Tax=Rhizoctonia solani TaxID=456999 RepID=A0A8H7H7Y9_9AGAM|nr:hypothetical protein RHS04_06289 [Rhizoctonia solani]